MILLENLFARALPKISAQLFLQENIDQAVKRFPADPSDRVFTHVHDETTMMVKVTTHLGKQTLEALIFLCLLCLSTKTTNLVKDSIPQTGKVSR